MRQFFITAVAIVMGGMCVQPAFATDEATAVKQAIKNDYSTFYQDRDAQKYRSLLTDDYLLLENGEILDVEGDIALMPSPDSGYERTDDFDFRSVKIQGDIAYAVYLLKSDITDKKNGRRQREFLESAILRRIDGQWRVALLHSTRTAPAATPPVSAKQPSDSKLLFNHLALSVKDVSASADFYGRVLDLPDLSKEWLAKGVRWFSLGEGKELHLISHEYYKGQQVVMNKAVHLALATSDFEGMLKRLESRQVPYGDWKGTPKQVETRSDGVKQIFLQDPDGYWIEINSAGEK